MEVALLLVKDIHDFDLIPSCFADDAYGVEVHTFKTLEEAVAKRNKSSWLYSQLIQFDDPNYVLRHAMILGKLCNAGLI